MATENMLRHTLRDLSFWLLLFSNAITIFFIIQEGTDVLTILWIFWAQSIIIGFFNFVRILQLKEFSTEGVRINNLPVDPTPVTKYFIAFFFLLNYGLFHFFYAGFLSGDLFNNLSSVGGIDIKLILGTALLFFINHAFSYFYNRSRETKKPNIGTIMFYPYLRIFPMHLSIILGALFGGVLFFFLLLKTISDALMHVVEHQVIRKGVRA